MKDYIRNELLTMGESSLREFPSSLIPGAKNMIGVRLPRLREYAKRLAASEGEKALEGDDIYYEETMLRGMVIGYLKTDIERRFELIRSFIPMINNWAVCDSFCPTLRFAKQKKNQALVWDFIQPYINSDKEFYARFGAVMLLDYFVNEEYIDRTLGALLCINTDAYYSSMAAAWLAAECYLKFPEKTLPVFREKRLSRQTGNWAIRKLCDSLRLDKAEKDELKAFLCK